MLTWNRLHRGNDECWPIRPDGSGAALECCFQLLQGGSFLLLQGGCLELLNCGGSPTPGICPTLPQAGIIATPVTWNNSLFFNAQDIGGGVIQQDSTLDFPFNPEMFAGTNEAITTNGQGFSFKFAGASHVPLKGFTVGLGSTTPSPAIDCGDNVTIIGNGCRWFESADTPINFGSVGFGTSNPLIETTGGGRFQFTPYNPTSVYTLIRCNDVVCMYIDNALILSTLISQPPPASARLNVFRDVGSSALPFIGNIVSDVNFLTNITCP